ncbi:Lipoprotein, putative [Sporocytophaga myxococcoides]|uniref:Lipoprotein, putative n=2 Tax=Sporocytophaga myxococcoides TaxID=153721 RepID=A0A098LE10_9BACT|nr:Lipoprotein, putative [Sporocytophaga myxococcoides]
MACSKPEKKELSISDFETKIKSDMDYYSMVETFGKPSKDIGRGIHIYVYELKDSTKMLVGFTDKVLYAKQINRKEEIVKDLLVGN